MSSAPFDPAITRDAIEWRRWLHAHPELGYELPLTATYVADRLREIGCDEVITGVANTGIVARITGRRAIDDSTSTTIALRADMDALPMMELGTHPHTSRHAGRMHACGHDGHMAMLLAAAAELASARDFPGTIVLVFQPAEEDGLGAQAILDSGVLDRLHVAEIYGLHNWPALPLGECVVKAGPCMASADRIEVTFLGEGGHAARPHETRDPIIAAAHFIVGAQNLITRERDPLCPAVLSLTRITGGTADNIVPDEVSICGTLRTLDAGTRELLAKRIVEFARDLGRCFRVTASAHVHHEYPVTVNHAGPAQFFENVARDVPGVSIGQLAGPSTLAAEDFGCYLREIPGAFALLGSGSAVDLHSSHYDFNDDVLPLGAALFVQLARRRLQQPGASNPT